MGSKFDKYEVGRKEGGLLLVAVRSEDGIYRAGISTPENLFYFHNVRKNFSLNPGYAWNYLGVNSRFADIDFGKGDCLMDKSRYGSSVAPKEKPIEADNYITMIRKSRLHRFINKKESREGIMGMIHHHEHGWLWSIIVHGENPNYTTSAWEKVSL